MSILPKRINRDPSKAIDERLLIRDRNAGFCEELIGLQRTRETYMKSRIMCENRTKAVVSGYIGYHSGLEQEDRDIKQKQAVDLIEEIRKASANGEQHDHPIARYVLESYLSIDAYLAAEKETNEYMIGFIRCMPIHQWIKKPDQCGLGELSVAKILGETGDLWNYSNPAKVWRRMGCAPWQFNGQTHMASSWRMCWERYGVGKLPSSEWEEYGHSPRRRAIMYVIGKGLINLNKGPYRARYDEVKSRCLEERDDMTRCRKCDGTGKRESEKKQKTASKKLIKCDNCTGSGIVRMHCDRHASLLMVKLLLKNLWLEWTEGTIGTPWSG